MVVQAELKLCRRVDGSLESTLLWDRVVELLCVVDLVRCFLLVDRDVVDLLRLASRNAVEPFTRDDPREADLPRLGDYSELTLVIQEVDLIGFQLRRLPLRLRQQFEVQGGRHLQ